MEPSYLPTRLKKNLNELWYGPLSPYSKLSSWEKLARQPKSNEQKQLCMLGERGGEGCVSCMIKRISLLSHSSFFSSGLLAITVPSTSHCYCQRGWYVLNRTLLVFGEWQQSSGPRGAKSFGQTLKLVKGPEQGGYSVSRQNLSRSRLAWHKVASSGKPSFRIGLVELVQDLSQNLL